MREYGVADGLLAVDSMKRHRTLVTDSRGRVWLALSRGISVADPGHADAQTLPALTHVESMSADGGPVDLNGAIAIPAGRRRIAFVYTGLSLSVPERVRYRYRLDGFDRDWSEPTADRQTVYTNLGHGQYRFRVIASNSDGLWNGSEASLAFEIRPMLWQTRWFQAAAVLIGLAAAGDSIASACGSWRSSSTSGSKSVSRSAPASPGNCTTRCCRGSSARRCSCTSPSIGCRRTRRRDPRSTRVLDLMSRVIEEGRNAVRGLRSVGERIHDLEHAFSGIQSELADRDRRRRIVSSWKASPGRSIPR